MPRFSHCRVLLLLAAPFAAADAHHSIAAVYDRTRQITVEGRVTEFQFVNPHPVLIIDVAVDGAAPEHWRLEMDNRSELADIGVHAGTFKPGDQVVAGGSAARDRAQGLYLLRLDRPADGLRYEQVGSRPIIKVNRRR